jgi:death on curing protein
LLESALARPQATAFRVDAYPDPDAKAAAPLHSLARNCGLVDGNKRLALAAVIAVADGTLDAVEQIAARLTHATKPW